MRSARKQPLQHESHQERPFQARSGNGVGGTWDAIEDIASISSNYGGEVKINMFGCSRMFYNLFMKQSTTIGERAPDFILKDAAGTSVHLSDVLTSGPIVLIFYPGDRTPGCTIQLCAIRDDWQMFEKLGISVFGVNHADAASHAAFASEQHFPFPLLVDPEKEVSRTYGATRSLGKLSVIRRTVVGISRDGIIRYYRRGLPKNAEILKAIKPFTGDI